MIEVVDRLNELFDVYSWVITIENNSDEQAIFCVVVDGDEVCSATSEDDLLSMLNDESTMLGF